MAEEQQTLVVGAGSPHGDDQVGWYAVDRMRTSGVPQCRVLAIRAPIELLDHLDQVDLLIVLDACASGRPPGTIFRWQWPDICLEGSHSSTHGVSIRHALEMAETLGCLPARVVLFGVEIATCEPGDRLSGPVCDAIPGLTDRVEREIGQPDA